MRSKQSKNQIWLSSDQKNLYQLILATMQYAAAVALASLSGKAPTKDSVTAILNASGKAVDAAQVDAVLKALNNRKVDEVISKGLSKVSVGASSGSGAASKKDDKKKEEKKPEPKKEAAKKPEPEPVPAAAAEEEDFAIDLFG